MKKRVISIVLSLVMLLTLTAGMHFSAYAVTDSGACGIGVGYTFDKASGTLTISGNGKMFDYVKFTDSPFYGAEDIKAVNVQAGVTGIGNNAFYECKKLESVTLPATLTSVGEYAFWRCYKLKSFTIPASVSYIGCQAFDDTGYYREKKNWEGGLLYNSSCLIASDDALLGDRTVKDGTRLIAAYTFSECRGLTGITLPASITAIENSTFAHCIYLSKVNLSSALQSIGADAFYDCAALTELVLPGSIKTIGSGAFSNCTALKTLTVSEGVKKIGEYAFNCCDNLETVILPLSLKKIEKGAFYPCPKIKNVYYPGTKAQWDKVRREASNGPLVRNGVHCSDDVTVLKVTKGKKSAKLRWKKVKGATSYEVRYSRNKDFSKAKTVKVKGKKVTIKKLTSGKKYYFIVRAVTGKNKGNWSVRKSVKVK